MLDGVLKLCVKLCVKGGDDWGRDIHAGLVPLRDEGIINRSIKLRQHDEAIRAAAIIIAGVIAESWGGDGGLQAHMSMALDGMSSDEMLGFYMDDADEILLTSHERRTASTGAFGGKPRQHQALDIVLLCPCLSGGSS